MRSNSANQRGQFKKNGFKDSLDKVKIWPKKTRNPKVNQKIAKIYSAEISVCQLLCRWASVCSVFHVPKD